MTRGQLLSKRDEFWDTAPAFTGRSEIWQALRAAAECEDTDTAQAIMSAVDVTCAPSFVPIHALFAYACRASEITYVCNVMCLHAFPPAGTMIVYMRATLWMLVFVVPTVAVAQLFAQVPPAVLTRTTTAHGHLRSHAGYHTET